MKASDIDEIILVGGSTRIPKIQQLVREFFGGKVNIEFFVNLHTYERKKNVSCISKTHLNLHPFKFKCSTNNNKILRTEVHVL